jgi:hypothetical protein
MTKKLSRRDLLKLAGLTSAGLALSACGVNVTKVPTSTSAPLTPAPLPTGTGTLTPTLLPTETLTPAPSPTKTLTPTPIPVEQLPVTKQAVAEFVRAFQAAGVNITSEQLFQKKFKIVTTTGKDEKQYEVAFVQVDNYGNYPLIIKKAEDEKWMEVTGNNTKALTGLDLAVFTGGAEGAEIKDYYSKMIEAQNTYFSFPAVYQAWRINVDPQWGAKAVIAVEDCYDKAKHLGTTGEIMLHPLLWDWDFPDEVKKLSGKDLRSAILAFTRKTVTAYPALTRFTLNELTPELLEKIGSIQEQQVFVHDMAEIVKSTSRTNKIILNENFNHGTDVFNGMNNKRFETALQRFDSDVDLIGMQLTVYAEHAPSEGWKRMVYESMKYYYTKYNKKLAVTELNVNIGKVEGEKRLVEQANIYQQLMEGIQQVNKEFGIVCITVGVLTIGDQFSPYQRNKNQWGYSEKANPTLFDDNVKRKLAWYGTMKGLISADVA